MSAENGDDSQNLVAMMEFDEDMIEQERQRLAKKKAKEQRIRTGHDAKLVVKNKDKNNNNDDDDEEDDNTNQNGGGDDEDDKKEVFTKAELERIANLTPEERETRWGFTHEELKAATKVVSILFTSPHLFVGDQVLADTRLFTMVSRDRATKRGNREVMKKMLSQEQKRKHQLKRAEDLAALCKTRMKQERDDALKALLLPPPPTTEDSADDDDEGDEENAERDNNNRKDDDGDGDVVKDSKINAPKRNIILTTFTNENDKNPSKPGVLNKAQACHICHTRYRELHEFYYSLCPTCADYNYAKRLQTRDLKGRKVLLTGCRIKIGYEILVSLLRCGAVVIGTTRFVHDCLNKLMQEKDYDEWKDRVHLFALDLRDLWMVEQFCSFLKRKFKTLFAIVNNAAQTVARTVEYTESLRFFESQPIPEVRQSLMAREDTVEWMSFFAQNSSLKIGYPLQHQHAPLLEQNKNQQQQQQHSVKNNDQADTTEQQQQKEQKHSNSNDDDADDTMMQLAIKKSFPRPIYDRYDIATESTDLRTKNSWTMNMHEVEGSEAAEVMAINALAPFIFNARLQSMLEAADEENRFPAPGVGDEKRFIINVSAMEGQFYRNKSTTHPHTNMAKAALNMQTRTSGADLAQRHIFLNSVDTGWITDELPAGSRQRTWTGAMQPCPLDEVDAAARVLDLIYVNSSEHSKFWKDYREVPW